MIVYARRLSQAVQKLLWDVYAAAYSLLDIAEMIDQGRLVPSFLSHFKTLYAPDSPHGANTSLIF